MPVILIYGCFLGFLGSSPLWKTLQGPGQEPQHIKSVHGRVCVSVHVCLSAARTPASVAARPARICTGWNKALDRTSPRYRRGFALNWFRLKDNRRWCWMMEHEELAPYPSPLARSPAKWA